MNAVFTLLALLLAVTVACAAPHDILRASERALTTDKARADHGMKLARDDLLAAQRKFAAAHEKFAKVDRELKTVQENIASVRIMRPAMSVVPRPM